MVGQLQEAVHPGAAAALPEAFRRAVAAEQAASRFPLDAQSPLQLRDVRPPALRSLPDPDAVLAAAPSWAVPNPAPARVADRVREGLDSDGSGRGDTGVDERASSSASRAGVYIWHDAGAKRRDPSGSRVWESGSSTQPAAWLQGIQKNTQQGSPSEADPERADDESREPVHMPLGRM